MTEGSQGQVNISLEFLGEGSLTSGRQEGRKGPAKRHLRLWMPPTDVLETEESLVVVVEIAGMRRSEISITFSEKQLTIQGERKSTLEPSAYHQMEIDYGRFECVIPIRESIVSDDIEAHYDDGFLRVRIPKAKPHRIQVE